MASEIGIVNQALLKVGARNTLTSLSDGSASAAVAGALYPDARDTLLRSHHWNFAIRRALLAEEAAAPAFGFARAFALPADWLRTVSVHAGSAGRDAVPYRIEGRRLVSDAARIHLRYVARIEDPNAMPPDFREALAALLAREFALPIANSATLRDRLDGAFRAAQRRARSTDGMEDFPEAAPAGAWASVRG